MYGFTAGSIQSHVENTVEAVPNGDTSAMLSPIQSSVSPVSGFT